MKVSGADHYLFNSALGFNDDIWTPGDMILEPGYIYLHFLRGVTVLVTEDVSAHGRAQASEVSDLFPACIFLLKSYVCIACFHRLFHVIAAMYSSIYAGSSSQPESQERVSVSSPMWNLRAALACPCPSHCRSKKMPSLRRQTRTVKNVR
jgi:hypothetical protein